MNNPSTIQLETTPRVYYEHYISATPDYDLYPSLSRYHSQIPAQSRPTRPNSRPKTDFIAMHFVPCRQQQRWQGEDNDPFWEPEQEAPTISRATPAWDLYPAILRQVENLGTDEMRERLHTIQRTTNNSFQHL
ncbi:hypothetical protein K501DRAFT_235417 [Backusella circina FSU 941]|nr:hypothetical protein K501DRAFT_235417 [Backusella circina FSU 941]